jgi:WD40 repeat protein
MKSSNNQLVIFLSKHNTYLPTDVLYIILSYLDPKNLISISTVNHTIHSCANANHLWNFLYRQKYFLDPKDYSQSKKCYIYKTKLEKEWYNPKPIQQVTQYVDLGRNTITCKLKFQRDVFSENDGYLICGLDDHTARVMKIDGRRLKPDKELHGHSSVIWCVDYNRKKMGQVCLTSGHDNR